jgi:hypothetical protein
MNQSRNSSELSHAKQLIEILMNDLRAAHGPVKMKEWTMIPKPKLMNQTIGLYGQMIRISFDCSFLSKIYILYL